MPGGCPTSFDTTCSSTSRKRCWPASATSSITSPLPQSWKINWFCPTASSSATLPRPSNSSPKNSFYSPSAPNSLTMPSSSKARTSKSQRSIYSQPFPPSTGNGSLKPWNFTTATGPSRATNGKTRRRTIESSTSTSPESSTRKWRKHSRPPSASWPGTAHCCREGYPNCGK
jgi:hypothetical protein